MTKKDIRQLLADAMVWQKIANVYMRYSQYYFNLIPVKIGECLFLAIDEDDFILNGFRISRLWDVQKVRVKNGICDEILRGEGVLHNLPIPPRR